MAIFKLQNRNTALVEFQEPGLDDYYIRANVVRYRQKTFVNFIMPTITFRHHDGRTLFDITDGIKKIVHYAAGQKDERNPRFNGRPEAPVFNDAHTQVRMRIFPNWDKPYVDARVEEDGFVRWTILGFYFNDDVPSAVKYVGCLEAMPKYVSTLVTGNVP